ncbi:MAG: hypothetical protein HZA93_29525 [Verrucomicrobia bacterium]|nr:hypothetical protein [Verrucomicrobiota bacterium]
MLLPLCSVAQSSNSRAEVATAKAARADAYEAFKTGNTAAGLAKLNAAVQRGGRAPNEDSQVASHLAAISFQLKNNGALTQAAAVAALHLDRATQGKTRMSIAERASSASLNGVIYEQVLGLPAQAKIAYTEALALDPGNKLVAQRLAQLNAIEAKAVEKATANAVLAQRALQSATNPRP